jgi:hypothetical protein
MSMKLLAVIVCALVTCGCADNATSLVDRISGPASRLPREAGSSLTVTYEPVTGTASPYTVIFFPERDMAEADLVAGGVDRAVARRIFSELAYLGSLAGTLVVEQEGERLTFTTSWKQLVDVQPPEDLVVSQRKTGTAEVELRRTNGAIRVVAIR